MTFIITLIILYLLWILLKPLLMNYARRKYQEKVNDMFNQAFGGGARPGSGPFGTSGSRQDGRHNAPPRYKQGRKKKIFSRDEGEYIEFEEIEVTTEYRYTSSSDPNYTPREPQVSDADWEEIR